MVTCAEPSIGAGRAPDSGCGDLPYPGGAAIARVVPEALSPSGCGIHIRCMRPSIVPDDTGLEHGWHVQSRVARDIGKSARLKVSLGAWIVPRVTAQRSPDCRKAIRAPSVAAEGGNSRVASSLFEGFRKNSPGCTRPVGT